MSAFIPAPFALYHPHPDRSRRVLAFSPYDYSPFESVKKLLVKVEPPIVVDLFDELIFLKVCARATVLHSAHQVEQPDSLPIDPQSTLLDRARQWLKANLVALDDEDQQLNIYRPIQDLFPSGLLAGRVHILLISPDGTRSTINCSVVRCR